MDIKKIDSIKRDKIPNGEMYAKLWQLSSMKGEVGFSFIVQKTYLETYKEDLESDFERNAEFKESQKDWYEFLSTLITSMETNILYIDND